MGVSVTRVSTSSASWNGFARNMLAASSPRRVRVSTMPVATTTGSFGQPPCAYASTTSPGTPGSPRSRYTAERRYAVSAPHPDLTRSVVAHYPAV